MPATKRENAMKLPLALSAVFLLAAAAIAADKPSTKPCPKGQMATTEKATGKQVCFAPQMMMGPAQPAGANTMAKPGPKAN